MYNTSHRTPKPLLPGDEGKNLGEKVGHGGELLFICFELEAYVARLELTNRNATVYKRDDGRLEKVYPESEAQGCTDVSVSCSYAKPALCSFSRVRH